MIVAVAGAHGQVARRLTRLLTTPGPEAPGEEVVGIVRNPGHVADVEADGGRAVVLDLEHATVEQTAEAVRGADVVVFAAGAGPGSGDARKKTVDEDAAVLLADAAQAAGVRRYVLVSSVGVDAVRDGAAPDGVDPSFVAYLRAKLAAEEAVLQRARAGALEVSVLRPGGLTDDPGTGRVALERSLPRGRVTRDDVAAVLAALVRAAALLPAEDDPVLELMAGEEEVGAAVARVLTPSPGA